MQGAGSLSDAELVAILLRTGSRGKDAVELARELLACFGGLRGLLNVAGGEMKSVKGLGAAKTAALLASVEIARRQLKEEMLGKNFLRDPKSVMDYLYTSMRDEKKEVFKAIYVNKANYIIAEETLFEGTVDETAIHTREVVKRALAHNATGVVFVHNHPSGRAQPSREDQDMTRRLVGALIPVGIKVLDHIIVGNNQCFSFAEQNLLLG